MLDLLLPTRCALCEQVGPSLCGECVGLLEPARRLAPPPGIEGCWGLLDYAGATRTLVAALKFRGHRDAVALLGVAMAALVDRPVDVVTWAPTSPQRARRRGFDQAELLARAVGRALGRTSESMLVRATGTRGDDPQTGLGRAERLDGPAFSPDGAPRGDVLLVDDVRTTGSTLCAASDALLGAGAERTFGLTLAVTA